MQINEFPRKIESELQKHLNTSEIVVLTGMRRVGKTTVYKKIFDALKTENKLFLDLENPINQKVFQEEDFDAILANFKALGLNPKEKMYLFLDEIQSQPAVVKAVKYLADHYDIKFFLTGSSSFYLKNLFPESLAGRKVLFEMYPLDFEEFLVFKGVTRSAGGEQNEIAHQKFIPLYEEYLQYGGFPQVVLAETIERKKEILDDVFTSYFAIDVRSLADFKEINIFRDLILLLFARVGSKVDVTKLASELGVTRHTISSYIAFLQHTYFIDLIEPYTEKIDRVVAARKKVYACDNGLLNHLVRVGEGEVFENAVYLNVRTRGKVNYYNNSSGGKEIDFVLPDEKIAYEVKLTGTAQDELILKKAAHSLGLVDSYVVSKKFIGKPGFASPTNL